MQFSEEARAIACLEGPNCEEARASVPHRLRRHWTSRDRINTAEGESNKLWLDWWWLGFQTLKLWKHDKVLKITTSDWKIELGCSSRHCKLWQHGRATCNRLLNLGPQSQISVDEHAMVMNIKETDQMETNYIGLTHFQFVLYLGFIKLLLLF
jgi:hypothetical protein